MNDCAFCTRLERNMANGGMSAGTQRRITTKPYEMNSAHPKVIRTSMSAAVDCTSNITTRLAPVSKRSLVKGARSIRATVPEFEMALVIAGEPLVSPKSDNNISGSSGEFGPWTHALVCSGRLC